MLEIRHSPFVMVRPRFYNIYAGVRFCAYAARALAFKMLSSVGHATIVARYLELGLKIRRPKLRPLQHHLGFIHC